MKISDNGLRLIAMFEDFARMAYTDTGGVWTIGFGHTRGVKEGDLCTMNDAEAWLREDAANAEQVVDHFIKVPLNQNQYDALGSFAYNLGPAGFRNPDRSPTQICYLMNAGDFAGAADQFRRWRFDNGREVQGLLTRRLREKELFLTP